MKLLPALSLTALALCSAVGGVQASELFSRTPEVHVALPLGSTQGQLAAMLSKQGYDGIRLSAVAASPANPHPETNTSLTAHPEQTPLRLGWNGVASKNGQQVQVYVDN
ncbi:hypothetical protein GALL_78600 [mine drainage metagenome]|uniref:Uncharacterized protein n=1 Tax=mine drainage metagenome TaxID=410659 RepID=A0A1J5SPP1_9ZZZZ